MNFSEVVITIFAAILLGVLFWVTMGSPPAEEQFSVARRFDIGAGLWPVRFDLIHIPAIKFSHRPGFILLAGTSSSPTERVPANRQPSDEL